MVSRGRPVAWLPDGSVVVADADTAVRFGPDGTIVRTYTPEGSASGGSVTAVAAAPDGRTLVLAGHPPRTRPGPNGGWVAVYDAATGKRLRGWETPTRFASAAFAPDGEAVVLTGLISPPRQPGPPAVGESTAAAVVLFDAVRGEGSFPFPDPTGATEVRYTWTLAVAPTGYQVAVAEQDNTLTVYELASGAVRRRLRGHRNQVQQLAFTPDGLRLVSVSQDGTGLVWDVGLPKPAAPVAPTDADRRARWAALGSDDGAAAHRAMGELAADPAAAVAVVRANLKPTPAPADAEIDKLIAGLDAEAFADREAAARDLDRLGRLAAPRVKDRLPRVESAEARKRLGEFLARHDRRDRLSGSRLQERRAVELLEALATPGASAALRSLADGGDAPLARDAAAALTRLGAR
jgi:hypothetical protein